MFKKLFYITLLFVLFNADANAQSSDSLFTVARTLGFDGKRAEARSLCYQALTKSPEYSDIWIFLGRLYSWDDQYDSARICIKKAISISPTYIDAYSALCDVELWSDNPLSAIPIADQALLIDSSNAEIRLKKARALNNSKQYKAAYTETQKLLEADPRNAAAFALSENIKRSLQLNKAGLTYDLDLFDKTFDPWHLLSLSYSRRTEALGTVVARLNYAYRFSSNAVQYEMDAYPTVSEKMYMYINTGVGVNSLFPDYRLGASLYRTLPKSFEGELGFRYLKFSTATWIFTGSIGKYWRNYWFNLRPNYIPGVNGASTSFNFTTRYYIKDADDFVTVLIGAGVSPDDVQIESADGVPNSYLLNSNRIRLSYQKLFQNNWYGYLTLGFANEETTFNGYRKNYTISIGFDKAF